MFIHWFSNKWIYWPAPAIFRQSSPSPHSCERERSLSLSCSSSTTLWLQKHWAGCCSLGLFTLQISQSKCLLCPVPIHLSSCLGFCGNNYICGSREYFHISLARPGCSQNNIRNQLVRGDGPFLLPFRWFISLISSHWDSHCHVLAGQVVI